MGKAYVVEYYDNLANSYLELYGSESLSGYHKAAYLVRRGGSRVLDLGCGMGGLGAGYFLGSSRYVGVDVSLGMLSSPTWDADWCVGGMGGEMAAAPRFQLRCSDHDKRGGFREGGDSLMREAARVGSLVVAVSPRESDNLFLMSRGAIIPPE